MPWSIKSRFLWAEKKILPAWLENVLDGIVMERKRVGSSWAWKKRQTWTCRNIEKSSNMSKKLCLTWQGCCSVWLKNVEHLWNNVKLIPLSWEGSSMENFEDGIEMKIKIPTLVSSLKNEKLFECKCNEITETIVVSYWAEIVDMPVTLSWNAKWNYCDLGLEIWLNLNV